MESTNAKLFASEYHKSLDNSLCSVNPLGRYIIKGCIYSVSWVGKKFCCQKKDQNKEITLLYDCNPKKIDVVADRFMNIGVYQNKIEVKTKEIELIKKEMEEEIDHLSSLITKCEEIIKSFIESYHCLEPKTLERIKEYENDLNKLEENCLHLKEEQKNLQEQMKIYEQGLQEKIKKYNGKINDLSSLISKEYNNLYILERS